MEDDVLGIRATIDASDVQQGADNFVQAITDMQAKTNAATSMMTQGLDSALNQIAEFGRTANGLSLQDLSVSLDNAKANFMSLSEEIAQQKGIIAETAFELKDLKDAYAQAKAEGNSTDTQKQQIEEAKEALAGQKRELYELTEAQKQAKENVDQLAQAYKEAQSATPSFDSVVNGAQTAEERIAALRDSFNNFQESIQQSQQGINDLSSVSADSQAAGDEGQAEIVKTIATRYIVEGADETIEKAQLVNDKIGEVSQSYAQSTAAAQTAYTEQGNLVNALEAQITNLQQVMQQAMKAGDMESASEAAMQIQTLEQTLTEAKERLAELQQQAETSNQSLSNFANDSVEIQAKVEQQGSAWGRLKEKISNVGSSIGTKLKGNTDKGKEAISAFGEAINGMGIPIKSTIAGFGNMTKASLRFLATPLGAVLGAIVLALKAVHTYLNKSAEGQKIMAKVSAFLGSIMSSITDIIVAFGKYFFKVISGSNSAVNEFAKNFVTMFKGAFSVVKDLAVGFGTIFKGVWQIITGEFSAGWQSIKDGAVQMGTGIKDSIKVVGDAVKTVISGWKAAGSTIYGLFTDKELANDLGKAFGGMISNAQKAAEAASKNLQLSKETDEAKMRGLEIDKQVGELKNKAYQTTGKEKDELLKQAKILQQQKYYGRDIIDQRTGLKRHEDGIYDVQKKQYDNLKLINGLHTQNLSTIKAERQARIGLAQTQAQAVASMRMLVRQEAANQRSMAKSAKSAAKAGASAAKKDVSSHNANTAAEDKLEQTEDANDVARLNATIKVEEAIANAKLAALKNGYEKTKEERDKQHRDELQQIEKQRKEAIDAEIKRQKAEFDAKQAIVKAKGGKIQKWDEKTMVDQKYIDDINGRYDLLTEFTQKKQQRSDINELSKAYDSQVTERENKINKLRSDINSLEELISKIQDEGEKSELEKLRKNAKEQLQWVEQNKDAWQQYINKYGTFLEKRAALDEKFAHDTQGLDVNSVEYRTALKEYKSGKSSLSTQELKSNIDWSSVFSDIGMMSSKMARTQLSQLQNYTKTDEFKGLNASDQKTITDAIAKLQQQASPYIIGAFKNFGKAVDNYKTALNELATLKEQEVAAYDVLTQAKQREAEATEVLAKAQDKLASAIDSGDTEAIKSAQAQVQAQQLVVNNAKEAVKNVQTTARQASEAVAQQNNVVQNAQEDVKRNGKNLSSSFSMITSTFQSLKSGSLSGVFNSIVGLVDSFHNLGKSSKDTAKQQENDAKKNSVSADQSQQAQSEMSKAIGAAGQAMQAVPNAWVKAIGAVLSVLDILGDDLEGGIGNLIGTLLEKIGSIIETLLSQIGNGKFFTDIGKGIWNLVGGIGRGFGDAFGIRDNWNDYRKASEQYEKLDKVWTSLISKKKEYLSLSYGEEARKVGQEYIELAKADLDATKGIAKQYLGAWKKGSHSAGYEFNKKMEESVKGLYWSDISSAVGVNINDIAQLTDLSYKQLETLKKKYTEWWIELPEQYRTYLDSIIEKQNTLEDAQDDVIEKLTGVKFDDMYSNFMSAISDMSKGADDFVSDFRKKMRSAIIQNVMGKEVETWIKNYTNRYQAAMQAGGGKISEAEKQALIDEAKEKSNYFFEKRKQITENLGLGATQEESSQKGGYATASEDSIEELSGRALATNEALYSIRDQQVLDSSTLTGIGTTLQNLVVIENNRNAYYDESIDIQRTSVSHLAAIEKNTFNLFAMSEVLGKIEKNTRNM